MDKIHFQTQISFSVIWHYEDISYLLMHFIMFAFISALANSQRTPIKNQDSNKGDVREHESILI